MMEIDTSVYDLAFLFAGDRDGGASVFLLWKENKYKQTIALKSGAAKHSHPSLSDVHTASS